MLYKLNAGDTGAKDLQPLAFLDFAALGKLEKDLEQLLATRLLDVLFEDAALMPIFRERAMQAEADLYALNSAGDLVIFELKRGQAGDDAMLQVLRYGQEAGQWSYNALEQKYRSYCANENASLETAHREAFNLDRALSPADFNARQRFVIVGNAANDALVAAVDYWKRSGILVDFVPYRVYAIGGEHYFEFFAIPYDRHQNPSSIKAVIFDTNRSYDEDAIWDMMEKGRVSAYGSIKHCVDYLNPGDHVFFSHKWQGIIAAAEVVGAAKDDGDDERYRDVRFLTPVPRRGEGIERFMPFQAVSAALSGKRFYWARTIKVPYLTRDEGKQLLDALVQVLVPETS